MLSITKKIAIVVSLVAACLGQLYASNLTDPVDMEILTRKNQAIAAVVTHSSPALDTILEAGSKSINPCNFRLVCSEWKQIMDTNNHPEETHLFKKQGFFMKRCMNIWWKEIFKNGELKYTSPLGGKEQFLKFSDLENVFKGTFDLSTCGNTANSLVITTDPERFFEVDGKNEEKVVVLIALHQVIEQEINSSAKHLEWIMPKWDAAKAAACIVWRWGGDKDLTLVDYLTTASLSKISRCSLFQNWMKCSELQGVADMYVCYMFSCLF